MKITCPQCGFSRNVADDSVPEGSVIARCPKCACRFRFSAKDGAGAILPPKTPNSQESEPEEEDIRETARQAYETEARRFENGRKAEETRERLKAEKEASRIPWVEAPAPDGWLAALYQTIIRVMFQANVFFHNLRPDAEMPRPMLFFLIICFFQTLVERFWGQVFYSFMAGAARDDPNLEKLLALLSPDESIVLLVALRCGALILQLYVFSLLMYLAYRLVDKSRVTFNLIFQVIAYSSAPWVLCIIPGAGSLAGTIWGIGCMAVGMKTALNLGWPQTVIGFLPLVIILAPILPHMLGLFGQ